MISDLIREAETGSRAAADQLFSTLYEELHRLAGRQLSRYGHLAPLGTTTLVHEAWLDIAAREAPLFPDRARFLGYASRAMRGLVIDEVRRRGADKRGGEVVLVTLTTELAAFAGDEHHSDRLNALSSALDQLSAADARLAELVDLHMFCGLSLVEVAALRGVSDRTTRRDWKRARDLLAAAMPGFAPAPLTPVRQTTGETVMIGAVLGRWELMERIGEGGMGTVWRARGRQGAPAAEAAVKLLNVSHLDPVSIARFEREGNVLARLHHPNIAKLLDAGVGDDGRAWLAMEFVDGSDLDAWCDAHALTTRQRLALLRQVMDAIAHAHGQRIIHRDLKPSNILVTQGGHVRLLDFGIAMELSDADGKPIPLTREGARALTPLYAAPEQVLRDPVSPATDIYALGVLLHVLLRGRHPTHEGNPNMQVALRGILQSVPVELGIPELEHIAQRALAKAPVDRYQRVDEMAADIDVAINRLPSP